MGVSKEIAWLLKEKYHNNETPGFFADVKRLESGEPLAYVIGWADFLGCHIDLSLRPLIPRPETEFWVEGIIQRSKIKNQKLKILDLFSGSGCIGIAFLKHFPNARVDFGEKEPQLCRQIKKNIALNSIDPARARIITTDVFSNVSGIYDLILANPPYIDPSYKFTIQDSVLLHEPHRALFAKDNGLYFIKKLLGEASLHLYPNGTICVEFGNSQKSAIAKLARGMGWKSEFAKDQFGKWRVVKLSYKVGP